jgi:hypothetical protein
LAGYKIQCRHHLPGNLRVFEIGKRLIPELALGRARHYFGRECHSCHSENDCIPSGQKIRAIGVAYHWTQITPLGDFFSAIGPIEY